MYTEVLSHSFLDVQVSQSLDVALTDREEGNDKPSDMTGIYIPLSVMTETSKRTLFKILSSSSK